ncbi:hypothetical protein [Crassaminicella profunda]|uniref:hypothetical protein n=1 Tax=Crassaminicella profunda TaxID=1286698 RepID=UPI001CA61F46|nr:hypothetical protein [Crassaminicella profunda]QZY55900.1 hypothetical protein K7H06_02465 [Crassaminicella profunda]
MKSSKETILEYYLKAFTLFVGLVTVVGLSGLLFSISWVVVNNISEVASNIIIAALLSIMGTRMVIIYMGTHKATFKMDEKSWKRRSLAFIYSMMPSVAGIKALKPVYASKRNRVW